MLGHNAIKYAMQCGYIEVTNRKGPLFIGPNSIDLHIGENLYVYEMEPGRPVDPRQPLALKPVPLMEDGS